MRLAPVISRFAGPLCLALSAMLASPGLAEEAPARLLILGEDHVLGDAPVPEGAIVVLNRLPAAGEIEPALDGARLKAKPVSVLPDTGPVLPGRFEDLFLVIRAEVTTDQDGLRFAIGEEAHTASTFAEQLAPLLDAFDAKSRRLAFLEITDPDDAFPSALPGLRGALDGLGFDMQVVTVSPAGATVCPKAQPLPYSIASGFADRAPFGNGDGITDMAEAEAYLGTALSRNVARGCGAGYSLILRGAGSPGQALVAHPMPPLPALEDRLAAEAFEAMFLEGSDNLDALSTYLETCAFCPGEAGLSARLEIISARDRIASLENEMWEEIRGDESRERLVIYVDHCRLCTHSDAALTRIEQLDAAAAAAEAEREAFLAAKEKRSLPALRTYTETCLACAHRPEAEGLIADLEADVTYQAERAQLTDALEEQNPTRLQAYLDSCDICDGADDVQATLDRLAALDAARAPCVALAGLPQMGGPRKLADIDRGAARQTCGAAAEAFPEDGLTQVLLGRIAQADGDFATAGAAYSDGMERGVGAAFGLAAFAEYAPADGRPIDPERVEALALQGKALGDWLSQEVLSVLYSKDLLPGKSGPEALEAALPIALEGNALAQFFVGHYYLTGAGGELSPQKAADWLQRAVDAGYTHAQSFLADLYEAGTAGETRADLAAELYWTGLQRGDAAATDRLTTDLASRSAEVVRIIQGRLREQGLYRGAVDGVPGPGTEAAIRAFASSVTGRG